MNSDELTNIPGISMISKVDLSQAYGKEFDADFDTDRVAASNVDPPYGGQFGVVLEVPNIQPRDRLFCKVEIQPTSCLYKSGYQGSVIPAQLLVGCAGSLTLGISMLGGGSASAEKKELGLHSGLGTEANQFRHIYSLATLLASSYMGVALQSKGFNVSGAVAVEEVPYHTEVARFVVNCHYSGCLPFLRIAWYRTGEVSNHGNAVVDPVPGYTALQRSKQAQAIHDKVWQEAWEASRRP